MRNEVEVPLGVGNIRRLTKQLKQLAKALRDDVPTDVEQTAGLVIAEQIVANIASITDVDGNYLGTDNPNASVVIEVGLPGHDVIWRGAQIAFVEFGTGAVGQGYPGGAMSEAGYQPDPTKQTWVYKDAKTNQGAVSHGLAPQAPMYRALAQSRARALAMARAELWKAVRDALSV